MAVKSKRLRFQILNRDDFTCQYCGRKPPEVTLHVDHILPVKEGGTDVPENLIAACAECNLGKAAKLLSAKIPPSPQLAARIEEIVEREQQLREYAVLQQRISERIDSDIAEARLYWASLWKHVRDLEQHHYPYRAVFVHYIKTIGLAEIKSAMEIVESKWTNVDPGVVRYLVGVMRNKEAEMEGRLVWCVACGNSMRLEKAEDATPEPWCDACREAHEEAAAAQRAKEDAYRQESELFAGERRRQDAANIARVDALLDAQTGEDDELTDIDAEVAAWDRIAEAAGF